MNTPRCTECRVAMEEGFIPDVTHGSVLESRWYPGEPEKATFFGLPIGIKIDQVTYHPIRAYRCPQCGLLRSYALPKPRPR